MIVNLYGTVFICALGLILVDRSLSQTSPGPSCLCFEALGDVGALHQALSIENAGDGSLRIFVAEQRGYIWTFLPDGTKLGTPFLNMTDTQIYVTINVGLYGMTFHPEFTSTQKIYLHYTARYDDTLYQRISEMTVSSGDPNVVDPSSERVLIDVFNGQIEGHMGGAIGFGDDGFLYFGIGDGMCCEDPLEMGQNKSTYQSGIHRIDVDSRTGNLPYGIPSGNPFLDEPETVPEMYAFGFRQPYTFTMDTGDRTTGYGKGRIFIGEIGETSYEEVNQLESGGNYGWSVWEGELCHDPDQCNVTGPVVSPIIAYNRTLGTCILLGGIYRGCMNPDLAGWMIFLDFGSAKFFGGLETEENVWMYEEIPRCEVCPGNLTDIHEDFPITMGADEAGEYYFSAAGSSFDPFIPGASVYKIVDPNKCWCLSSWVCLSNRL